MSGTHRVPVGRPALVLALAGLLALGMLLVPAAPPAPPRAGSSPAGTATPVPAPDPACTQVRDSLRPVGPQPPPGAMPAGSTMAAIAARGRLIVGVDQGKYLLGYRDPATGELAGADVDLARRLAAALLGDPSAVRFVVLDVADRVGAIERGQVDAVVNTLTVTCARQRSVEFSTAYRTVAQRLLVPVGAGITEVEDLAGQRVCTSAGSTTVDVLQAQPAGLVVVTEPGIPDCVLALQQGRVAAVSSDDVILAGLAAQDPQTAVVGRSLADAVHAIGMHRDAADLVRFVNAELEAARADGSLAAIGQRWLGGVLDPLPPPPPARYRD